MKNQICKILVISMAVNTLTISPTWASDIKNAHPCEVKNKSTKQVIQAICGQRELPDGVDHTLYSYRTFTDPNTDEVIEQFHIGKKVRTIKYKPAKTNIRDNEIDPDQLSIPTKKTEDDSWSTTAKVLTIGAAVIGVVGTVVGIRAIMKKGSKSAPESKNSDFSHYNNAFSSRNEPAIKNLRQKITTEQGQKIRVAGAVPSGDVPTSVQRYQARSGETYIIQKNPDTGLLETLILMDMLQRPYYHGYNYSSSGNTFIDNSVTINDLSSSRYSVDTRSYSEDLRGVTIEEKSSSLFETSSRSSDYSISKDTTTDVGSSEYTSSSYSSSDSSSSSWSSSDSSSSYSSSDSSW